jgi:hypothetical protein
MGYRGFRRLFPTLRLRDSFQARSTVIIQMEVLREVSINFTSSLRENHSLRSASIYGRMVNSGLASAILC